MNLINKKTLQNKITHFQFPQNEELEKIQKIINAWQVALKDHDLDKTKETSVQGDFLTRFFEYILGYKNRVSGEEEWNLEKEPKNEIDSQEPDGSLGLFRKEKRITRAVIELKDARTSLDKRQSGREKVIPL
jgi:hypothetical protein